MGIFCDFISISTLEESKIITIGKVDNLANCFFFSPKYTVHRIHGMHRSTETNTHTYLRRSSSFLRSFISRRTTLSTCSASPSVNPERSSFRPITAARSVVKQCYQDISGQMMERSLPKKNSSKHFVFT